MCLGGYALLQLDKGEVEVVSCNYVIVIVNYYTDYLATSLSHVQHGGVFEMRLAIMTAALGEALPRGAKAVC